MGTRTGTWTETGTCSGWDLRSASLSLSLEREGKNGNTCVRTGKELYILPYIGMSLQVH